MKVLIVRHAVAEERENWNQVGKPDDLRPLTKKGIQRFCEAVEGLCKLVPRIHHIYTSPLTRTVQTTELLANRYHDAQISTLNDLSPGGNLNVIKSLLSQNYTNEEDERVLCLVGHQPDLGELASFLISDNPESLIRFKKGGAAYFSFRPEQSQLQWLLTQRHLSFIGKVD